MGVCELKIEGIFSDCTERCFLLEFRFFDENFELCYNNIRMRLFRLETTPEEASSAFESIG